MLITTQLCRGQQASTTSLTTAITWLLHHGQMPKLPLTACTALGTLGQKGNIGNDALRTLGSTTPERDLRREHGRTRPAFN